jgi:hypothetical protein
MISLAALFDPKTALNSLGVLLAMVGVYLVYRNSPLNESVIDGGTPSTDFAAEAMRTVVRNRAMTMGVYLVLFGSLVQLVSNLVVCTVL